MDPRNGDVIALVGGRDFGDSQFNRATQASRQPGSAFKPFVYAAAFDQGYAPTHRLMDRPLRLVLDLIAGLQSSGAITVARMCVTCRFFRRDAHPGSARPHHCALVDAPMATDEAGYGSSRNHCATSIMCFTSLRKSLSRRA